MQTKQSNMSWLNNMMEAMSFANHNKPHKEVHFSIVNNTKKTISIRVFNEDPSEVCEEDEDDVDFCSGIFNGFEALAVIDLAPQQKWTHRRECFCADCHVGTIQVETAENIYYFDAAKGATKSTKGMDSSTLITAIHESSPVEGEGSSGGFLMDTVLLEEEVMEVEIADLVDTGAPRVITLTIENRPARASSGRERRMSHGALEASIAQLEFEFF